MNVMTDKTWGYEREGYAETPTVAYAPATGGTVRSSGSSVRMEERIGSLVSIAGAGWITYLTTLPGSLHTYIWTKPEPFEMTAIGVLIWLHAKWRRSVMPR